MTALLPIRFKMSEPYRQCENCLTRIPVSHGSLCYFCARPPAPPTVSRLEHVRNHLREEDRPLLDYLIAPLSFDQIAAEMGPGWTRHIVETAWTHVRGDLGLPASSSGLLQRIAVLRIVTSLERCFCGK